MDWPLTRVVLFTVRLCRTGLRPIQCRLACNRETAVLSRTMSQWAARPIRVRFPVTW